MAFCIGSTSHRKYRVFCVCVLLLYSFLGCRKVNSGFTNIVNEVGYPFFFYQLPEFIPTLAIAIGISPPNVSKHTFIGSISCQFVTFGGDIRAC